MHNAVESLCCARDTNATLYVPTLCIYMLPGLPSSYWIKSEHISIQNLYHLFAHCLVFCMFSPLSLLQVPARHTQQVPLLNALLASTSPGLLPLLESSPPQPSSPQDSSAKGLPGWAAAPPPTPVRCYLSPSQHKGRALPKLSHIPVIFETSKGRMKRDLKVKHLKTVACPRGCATPKSPGEGEHSGSVGIVLLSSGFQVF